MKSEKKNEKKNNRFLVALVALILLGVSVGYALISRNYTFKGTANVTSNTWNITPPTEDDITVEPAGEDKPTVTVDPESKDVTIEYTANLAKPGDYYSFVTPIKNDGTINATLQSVTEVTGLTDRQKEYLTYTIESTDGEALEGHTLNAGETINVKITVTYRDDNQDKLPTEEEAAVAANLQTRLNFVQAK